MSVEMCIECDEPTGKAGACEDSLYVGDNGPFCETCFEWRVIMAEHEKEKERLGAEIVRLEIESGHWIARTMDLEKELEQLTVKTERLPGLLWKAERYREVCDVLKRPQGEDIVGMVASIKREWEQLRGQMGMSAPPKIEGHIHSQPEFDALCVRVNALEAEVERLNEKVKTAHADGASALIASFENVDPRARICELEAEVERLREETKLLPELTRKAERFTEIWNIATQSRSADAMQSMEATWRKWEQLRAGTHIPMEQALLMKMELAAEVERLKAHTWEQERAAVVAWLTKRYENTSYLDVVRIVIKQSAEMIERGEHWPKQETP